MLRTGICGGDTQYVSDQDSAPICQQTTGLNVRLNLQLEVSSALAPHVLELSPATARGPPMVYHSATSNTPSPIVALGDFRDPSRMERVPYLRFAWPWDNQHEESWAGSLLRRRSLVPHRSWCSSNTKTVAVRWRNEEAYRKKKAASNIVSVPLPLELSGLHGNVVSPGARLLESREKFGPGEAASRWSATQSPPGARTYLRASASSPPLLHKAGDVVLVEVFDMGPYAPLEHALAKKIQRLWRTALEALRAAKLWRKWEAECFRWSAATRVQACYRAWKGREDALKVKQEAAKRTASAVVIQRAWR